MKTSDSDLKVNRNVYPDANIFHLGHYPTFSYSDECRTKISFRYVKRMLPLFRAVGKFCSINRLFIKFSTKKLTLSLLFSAN